MSIPTIIGGKPVSEDEARRHFNKTGEHLGVLYRDASESLEDFYKRVNADAMALHERQAAYYSQGLGNIK